MVTADLNRTISECRNAGVQLDVSGDKLIIRGNKMCPALRTLSALLAQDRRRVLAAVQNIEAAAKAEPPTPPPTSDLTFTLADVDELSFDTPPTPAAGFYRRTYGTITAYTGQTVTPADALFEVKRASPLHRLLFEGYKKWLWQQMQTDAVVLAELFEIANLAYCGCNTYVKGNNAAAIAAAATYELQQAAERETPKIPNG